MKILETSNIDTSILLNSSRGSVINMGDGPERVITHGIGNRQGYFPGQSVHKIITKDNKDHLKQYYIPEVGGVMIE
jgi:hypothetical protein